MGETTSLVLTSSQDHDDAVRAFSAAEDPTAAERFAVTLGKGFAGDPGNDFFCGRPEQYEQRWRHIANNVLLRNPHVRALYCTGPECGTAAMAYVYPDEKAPENAPEPAGLVDLTPYNRAEAIPSRDSMFAFMGDRKAAFLQANGRFLYIAFVATVPELQGRGYGSRLVRHLTDIADARGLWCYLEATNSRNAGLYERHGFSPLGEPGVWTLDSLPGCRAMLIPMARPPAASPAAAAAASE